MNSPQDLALQSILSRWTLIKNNTNIPKSTFLSVVKFVLSSTYFTFNNIIYKQTFGTSMGSLLSPVIANLILQDIEEKALKTINLNLFFLLPLRWRHFGYAWESNERSKYF